ncbi:uncharacterized protein LOC142011369 isoform X2 [Carettochelys insculpta]|uniref:uncharacterized protein LOC142011369 isoform X2 n=1 Tax=Carettochelys insculpta TaxID=44489 RepID=UPI003EBD15AA
MPKPKARGYTPPSPPELMDHAAFRPRSATKSLPSAGLLLNQTHFGPSLPKSGQEQKTSMGIPGQTRPEWDLEQEATKAVWVMEGKRLFCWDQIKSFLCAKIKRWTLLVRDRHISRDRERNEENTMGEDDVKTSEHTQNAMGAVLLQHGATAQPCTPLGDCQRACSSPTSEKPPSAFRRHQHTGSIYNGVHLNSLQMTGFHCRN